MKKVIRLTESNLVKLVHRIINESKKTPSKSEILDMSKEELKDVYGTLSVKGTYLGEKGEFHHFKKVMENVICSFRSEDVTPTGLKRNTQAIKVKDKDVVFKK
jgi:hypothetical protein